jgi:DNA modification methylase
VSRAVALKIVEKAPVFCKEAQLWSSGKKHDSHSLHYSVSFPEASPPELFSYFISKYSEPGNVVLDPFCGVGTGLLEACLLGRIGVGSDINPLSVRIAAGKLFPADLTEVMLALQVLNLMRPINSDAYNNFFAPFYDINTFRELVNLRRFCLKRSDRVSRFIELVALGLLHGHSAGYFSVYTYPQAALTPENQSRLNSSRRQVPDYRSVVPRILKKTASIMRDGFPSVLRRMTQKSRIVLSDARNLSYLNTGCVDLVVTVPPLPHSKEFSSDLWLKLWFTGISAKTFVSDVFHNDSKQSWLGFMNEALLEMGRVVRPKGRAVIALSGSEKEAGSDDLEDSLVQHVGDELPFCWEVEGVFINKFSGDVVRRPKKPRFNLDEQGIDRVVVLRRV